MAPREWDAFRVYYRRFPRFDPWLATAMVCQVVASCFAVEATDERPLEDFYMPSILAKKRKRKRATRRRQQTAEDFDRVAGI